MRHLRKGRQAQKLRRQGALERLLTVSEPNKRQQAEIEVLQKRIGI